MVIDGRNDTEDGEEEEGVNDNNDNDDDEECSVAGVRTATSTLHRKIGLHELYPLQVLSLVDCLTLQLIRYLAQHTWMGFVRLYYMYDNNNIDIEVIAGRERATKMRWMRRTVAPPAATCL